MILKDLPVPANEETRRAQVDWLERQLVARVDHARTVRAFGKQRSYYQLAWLCSVTIGAVATAYFGGLWLLFEWFGRPNFVHLGVFGDAFGALNSLFSGLAFTGVFVAILMQREELANQRLAQAESEAALERTTSLQARAAEAALSHAESMAESVRAQTELAKAANAQAEAYGVAAKVNIVSVQISSLSSIIDDYTRTITAPMIGTDTIAIDQRRRDNARLDAERRPLLDRRLQLVQRLVELQDQVQ